MKPYLKLSRDAFHHALVSSILTIRDGVPSNADKDNKTSVELAFYIAEKLGAGEGAKASGQHAGDLFENLVAEFIANTFTKLNHIRPGEWEVKKITGRNQSILSQYGQYHHLEALQQATLENPVLAASLGNDYVISPDVVVVRKKTSDDIINAGGLLVDSQTANRADMRQDAFSLLHASISTKWTLRSDRAQNARSEALNLIRNRKGRQPHIVAVVGEPLPSRLVSLALGTGDIDCVYHFALDELLEAVECTNHPESKKLMDVMIDGRRLKDIADLPLDLAI